MRSIKIRLVLFIHFILLANLAWAGLNIWAPTEGPEGGQIQAAAIDPVNPDIVYAAAGRFSSKIFKSINGGTWWYALITLQGGPEALVIDRLNTSTLYLGTGSGIYKSTDAGATWAATNNGLSNLSVNSVAIDPQNSQVIYAGTSNGLFKSSDAGTNWARIQSELISSIQSIVIDPDNTLTLYAAGDAYPLSSIVKSEDGGNTWNSTGIGPVSIARVVINPVYTNNVFAVGYSSELYKTIDEGTTWTTIQTPGRRVTALAIDPSNGMNVYSGQYTESSYRIFKSTDQGNTWRKAPGMGPLKSAINSFEFISSSPSTIFAATFAGMFKTHNRGKTWSAINIRLNAAETTNLAISSSGTLYAGTIYNGLFKSIDSVQRWKPVKGLPGTDIVSIQTDPENNKILYTALSSFGKPKGIFKSNDSSKTWRAVNEGLRKLYINDIKIAPSNSEFVFSSTGDTIYKSSNKAETWEKLDWNCDWDNGLILAVDPTNHNRIHAGFYYGGTWSVPGFSRSEDGGETWDCEFYPGTVPLTMGIDPINPQTVYVGGYDGGTVTGGEDGLFKSTNSGSTWSMIMNGLPQQTVFAFAIDPNVTSTIYVSVRDGIFKSIDGGNNWTPFNSGLENTFVQSILIDPNNTNRIYAGTAFGVYSIEQLP